MSERPYQPFYKPYGMTDEECEYKQRIAAEKLEQWKQEQNESNLLDALVSRNFGGVRFHKISPPRNNPSKRIPKHNDIINEVGNYFLKPNERLDLDFTNSGISDKEVGVIRTLITSKFNVHTKYKNRVLRISRAKISGNHRLTRKKG